jgi:DNA mismatch repair ATPase MutS
LNVARLAKVPKTVIDIAAIKSKELETSVEKRKIQSLYVQDSSLVSFPGIRLTARSRSRIIKQVLESEDGEALDRLVAGIEQL